MKRFVPVVTEAGGVIRTERLEGPGAVSTGAVHIAHVEGAIRDGTPCPPQVPSAEPRLPGLPCCGDRV